MEQNELYETFVSFLIAKEKKVLKKSTQKEGKKQAKEEEEEEGEERKKKKQPLKEIKSNTDHSSNKLNKHELEIREGKKNDIRKLKTIKENENQLGLLIDDDAITTIGQLSLDANRYSAKKLKKDYEVFNPAANRAQRIWVDKRCFGK